MMGRTVACCNTGNLDDERHLLCESTAMHAFQLSYAHLLLRTKSAKLFTCQQNLCGIACFIYECMKVHDGL